MGLLTLAKALCGRLFLLSILVGPVVGAVPGVSPSTYITPLWWEAQVPAPLGVTAVRRGRFRGGLRGV